MNNTTVSLSKRKTIITVIGTGLFVLSGFLMVVSPEKFISFICRNPEIIRITGIASICFFGLCLIFIARKLFSNRPGLIIDTNGITNNTNAIDIGLIEWKDITGVEVKQVMSNRFLILHTNNPEKYIDRTKNAIAKLAMNMNYKTCGSPITIISNSLKIDFNDLEKLIRLELEKRKTYR